MFATIKKEGLSGYQLKYLALFAMVLDHIHYFFEYTGKVPAAFSMIGRIAAPIFLFCIIEGFDKTHDRKAYFFRIYILSILMGLIRFGFYNVLHFAVRGDGFMPQNAMLSSFIPLLVVLFGFRKWEEHKRLPALPLIICPIILPYVYGFLFQTMDPAQQLYVNLAEFTVLPAHIYIQDGGTATLITGILFYVFRKSRKKQLIAFSLFVLVMDIALPLVAGLSVLQLFTEAFSWMEIFAVLPLLCYNGKRGQGSKVLFYAFYPLHIYVLYMISFFMYP